MSWDRRQWGYLVRSLSNRKRFLREPKRKPTHSRSHLRCSHNHNQRRILHLEIEVRRMLTVCNNSTFSKKLIHKIYSKSNNTRVKQPINASIAWGWHLKSEDRVKAPKWLFQPITTLTKGVWLKAIALTLRIHWKPS